MGSFGEASRRWNAFTLMATTIRIRRLPLSSFARRHHVLYVMMVGIAAIAAAMTHRTRLGLAAGGRPFTVQLRVLPSGRMAAPVGARAPSVLHGAGASTPLPAAQKQHLLHTTPAPSVSVTYE